MTICFDHVRFGRSGVFSMHRLLAAFFAVFVVFAGPVLAQPSRYLISAQPMTETPPGVQAWRIQYWTTNGSGQRFAVTCIVAAPMEAIPPRPRRVIAWTHGAWGVAEKCAPSLSPDFFPYSAGMDAEVGRGSCRARWCKNV